MNNTVRLRKKENDKKLWIYYNKTEQAQFLIKLNRT